MKADYFERDTDCMMRVFGTKVSTAPKEAGIRFLGGDVCSPLNGHMLTGNPWPSKVLRFWCPLPILPFLCVKVGRFGCYAGAKVYGSDQNYANWMTPADYESGGLAIVLTARFFTDG